MILVPVAMTTVVVSSFQIADSGKTAVVMLVVARCGFRCSSGYVRRFCCGCDDEQKVALVLMVVVEVALGISVGISRMRYYSFSPADSKETQEDEASYSRDGLARPAAQV